ncbi:MAG: hypothetical protein IJ619_12840 [Eubacterium sp.]|nr:hypothetical protein [Eubacterium sp.]
MKKSKGKNKKRRSMMPVFLIIGTVGIALGVLLFGGGEDSGINYIIENVGTITQNKRNGNESNLEDIMGSDYLPKDEPEQTTRTAKKDAEEDDDDFERGTHLTYGGGNMVSGTGTQQYITYSPSGASSPYYSDPGMIALTTTYNYVTVDNNYFADALFIGDSRTEGMRIYGGLPGATFYSKNGETIYNLMSDPIATNLSGAKVTIAEALRERQFGKIYIMIGINNLGIGTTAGFKQEYANVLSTIRALQPNAIIYIQANINMTTAYSMQSDYMNNTNLNDKNVASASFANGIDIFYLDVNDVLTDPDRGLAAGSSPDGIHMNPSSYTLWVNYLKTHAVVR